MRFLLLGALLSLSAQAQILRFNNLKQATFKDPKCKTTQDPYEVGYRFSDDSFSHSGTCLDSQRFRAPIILEDDETFKFANYFHDNQYWIAEISKSEEIDQLYYQLVRFNAPMGVVAAHAQLRARFKNPKAMKLTSQKDPSKVIYANDIVPSYEAGRPKGVPYSLAMGAVDNFVFIGRTVSGAQRVAENPGQSTDQFEILLDQESKQETLYKSIRFSSQIGAEKFYNTIKPNCTTILLDLFDSLNSRKDRAFPPFYVVLSNNPIAGPSLKALKERGLLGEKGIPLERELGIDNGSVPYTAQEKGQFLLRVEGRPWSLVFLTQDDPEKLGKVVKTARNELIEVLPQLLVNLGSNLMLAKDNLPFLLKSLKKMAGPLKSSLKKISANADDRPTAVTLYFVPWRTAVGEKINLTNNLGLPLYLPFDTYQANETQHRTAIATVYAGYNELQSETFEEARDLPFIFRGLAIQMNLHKGKSSMRLQVMGGLQGREIPQNVKNELVEITHLKITEATELNRTNILTTLTIDERKETPDLFIDFGIFGGLVPDITVNLDYNPRQGILQTNHNCEINGQWFLAFEGFLLNIMGASVRRPVRFGFRRIEMDLEQMNIKRLDVLTDLKLLGQFKRCMRPQEVADGFKKELNKKIADQKQDLESQMTSQLEGATKSALDSILRSEKD